MHSSKLAYAAGSLVILGAAQVTQAQVSCGEVITDARVMTANLVSCGVSPALTIGAGGHLDMNGFSVATPAAVGIEMSGSGGSLSNGGVTNCVGVAAGVLVTGSGNRIENVAVRNCHTGFRIEGSANKLTRTVASENGSDGFLAFGAKTSIVQAYAFDNGFDGFHLEGAGSKLTDVVAEGSTVFGVFVSGEKSKLSDIVALQNGNGVFGGPGAKLQRITSIQNNNGIKLSSNAKLKQAKAIGNTIENIEAEGSEGIQIDKSIAGRGSVNYSLDVASAGKKLQRSLSFDAGTLGLELGADAVAVKDNFFAGDNRAIQVDGDGNLLQGNASANSFLTPTFVDNQPSCGANSWTNNAGVGNLSCVD
jgi:hypothetical protein